MKKYLAVSLLLSLFTLSAQAGTRLAPQTISMVESGWGAEGLYVHTVEGLTGDGCTAAIGRMDVGHTMFEENLSLLLSAFHADTKVQLYVEGCWPNGQMVLKAVRLAKP